MTDPATPKDLAVAEGAPSARSTLGSSSWALKARVGLLILAYGAILVLPHCSRLMDASLYGDDVNRIYDLQTRPLGELLFRPFNEHMAPFFETVSWVAWQAAGRRLTRAPIAFTIASYVPFVLVLGLLTAWLRRETGSLTTALCGTLLFGLCPLSIEAVDWFSASSFTWALLWTMLGLICAGPALRTRPALCSAGLLSFSILAPSSSAIGLLAGPLVALRIVASPGPRRWGRALAAFPLAGVAAYLAVCSIFRYRQVILVGLTVKADRVGGLSLALQAPTARLILGTLGLDDADLWLPPGLFLAGTGLGLVAILRWGILSRQRGLILAALGLILGGYAITYPFRNQNGSHWLLHVGRFHLFPQLGFVILASLAATRWARRFDRGPRPALLASVGLGLILLAVHFGRFEREASFYRYPEQRETLAALERLGATCRDVGVSRDECIAALPPIWNRWYQPCYNGFWMVPAPSGIAVRPASEVRATLLGRLSSSDRKALWGGMDVSALVKVADDRAAIRPTLVAVGRLIESEHARCLGPAAGGAMRSYAMTGWPSDLVFEWTAPDASTNSGPLEPRFLEIACGACAEPIEISWSNPGEPWSPSRSVRLWPDPNQSPCDWVLSLARLPHWDPGDAGRIRVRFASGPLAIGEPRLLR